jgi:hypothetical protein
MANNLWEDKEIHLDSGDKGFMYVLKYCTTKSLSKCLTNIFVILQCFVCHYSHWNISWNFDGSLVYFSRKNVKQR